MRGLAESGGRRLPPPPLTLVSYQVTFIAGNERGDDHKAFAQRMKDEFELMTQSKEASN